MTKQSEQTLENNLIQQLVGLGYEQVDVTDDKQLVVNFKVQLQRSDQRGQSNNQNIRVSTQS